MLSTYVVGFTHFFKFDDIVFCLLNTVHGIVIENFLFFLSNFLFGFSDFVILSFDDILFGLFFIEGSGHPFKVFDKTRFVVFLSCLSGNGHIFGLVNQIFNFRIIRDIVIGTILTCIQNFLEIKRLVVYFFLLIQKFFEIFTHIIFFLVIFGYLICLLVFSKLLILYS